MAKYMIKVEQVADDGTRQVFAFGDGRTEITCDGFVILGMTQIGENRTKTTAAMNEVNISMIAGAIDGNKYLMRAAQIVTLTDILGEELKPNAAD